MIFGQSASNLGSFEAEMSRNWPQNGRKRHVSKRFHLFSEDPSQSRSCAAPPLRAAAVLKRVTPRWNLAKPSEASSPAISSRISSNFIEFRLVSHRFELLLGL